MDTRINILYAENDIPLRTRVSSYFAEKQEVEKIQTAQNVSQLLGNLSGKNIDLVITDIYLDGANDFNFLAQIRKSNPKVTTIVTTELGNDRVIQRLCESYIDYTVVKPFNIDSLFAQALLLCKDKSKSFHKKPLAKKILQAEKISFLLDDLGIASPSIGYGYLVTAVSLVLEDRSRVNCITKKLYPLIADFFHTSNDKVERAIRQVITNAWKNSCLVNFNPRNKANSLHQHDKPTNAEFIAMVADRVMLDSMSLQ